MCGFTGTNFPDSFIVFNFFKCMDMHIFFCFPVIVVAGFYRFGVGEFDWAEFTPRLKQKTFEEIKEYVV